MIYLNKFLVLILFIALFSSCKKYLDIKPDKRLVVPRSLVDLQALLDNQEVMTNLQTSFDEASSDNFYLSQVDYDQLDDVGKNTYLWKNLSYNSYPNDWSYCYDINYYSNVVLDGIKEIDRSPSNSSDWDNAKGSALFFQAQALLKAIFLFCNAYDQASASTDLGIALRLTSDLNEISRRSTLEDSYKFVITNLKSSLSLLPESPIVLTRPSRPAALALLARTYLSMRKYDSAFYYSDQCLRIRDELINYNSLSDINGLFPFERFNREVLLDNLILNYNYAVSPFFAIVDSNLYESYMIGDLRKDAFFIDGSILGKTGYIFKGTYNNTWVNFFTGVATDEVFLMRAECFARMGQKTEALEDLNILLKNRWRENLFTPVFAQDSNTALEMILQERRKELIFRGLRWMDIKRLNKEGRNIVLSRKVGGVLHQILPNEKRYALALPRDVVSVTGMPQNPY